MDGLKWKPCYKKSRVLASARMPPLIDNQTYLLSKSIFPRDKPKRVNSEPWNKCFSHSCTKILFWLIWCTSITCTGKSLWWSRFLSGSILIVILITILQRAFFSTLMLLSIEFRKYWSLNCSEPKGWSFQLVFEEVGGLEAQGGTEQLPLLHIVHLVGQGRDVELLPHFTCVVRLVTKWVATQLNQAALFNCVLKTITLRFCFAHFKQANGTFLLCPFK